MKLHFNPDKETWRNLVERPAVDAASLGTTVSNILREVQLKGDEALYHFNKEFSRYPDPILVVSPTEIQQAKTEITPALLKALQTAAANIRAFHQLQQRHSISTETLPGIRVWREIRAIDAVGLYIPGGSAPLFSTVLMLGIPAMIAGCNRVVICTPPSPEGKIHPAILVAADLCGITRIYKCGGAQAIAAMAYGTKTIERVDKIFGPGNQYVTKAKQLISLSGTAVDLPAGPSEVLVIADESARPDWVAADLLAQAEHGPDSQVVLLTNSRQLLDKVAPELEKQLSALPREGMARESLSASLGIVFDDLDTCVAFSDLYAPEHLILQTSNSRALAATIRNAGSVFVGPYSPESAGDYATGTNHTLPTQGYARAYSGVSLESFQKSITFQELTPAGLQAIAQTVEEMAAAEGLEAHRNSVRIRL